MDGREAAKQTTSHSPGTLILMVAMYAPVMYAPVEAEARKAGIRSLGGKEDIRSVVEGRATILEDKTYFRN